MGFRERTKDRNLVTKDLRWWPGDASGIAVDAVDDEFAAAADVVDRVFEDLWGTGGLSKLQY